MISGRRLQRLLEQFRWRWLVTNDGPNRHERRGYLVQMRRQAKAKAKEPRERFPIRDPDVLEE